MRILVVGSGAREHAVLCALVKERSRIVHDLFVVGGNPGIWEIAELARLDADDCALAESDIQGIVKFTQQKKIELVIIGPEAPLDAGIVDALRAQNGSLLVFGPTKAAAKLESSKIFAKEIMRSANISTAKAWECSTFKEVKKVLNELEQMGSSHFVVKADDLAAGKGVVVAQNVADALSHAEKYLVDEKKVLVEEYMQGPEFSLFFICDGQRAIPLMPAQDFKRIFDNDEGPNTGGMGSYAPLDWLPNSAVNWATDNIAMPVLNEMKKRGTPFVGVLFAGLMYTRTGIKVIEFNVRFGDPETQVVLEALKTPLSKIATLATKGELEKLEELTWSSEHFCNIVLASAHYPESSSKGDVIKGISKAEAKGAVILHAGTAFTGADIGQLVTNGGRVLSVLARGKDLKTARERAYNYARMVTFQGAQMRSDIALRAVNDQISI
ncbi:MAG: phosphoribosylamine--glycine ligase [Candidatus Ancillula trichonymphae]|nr:phosphoribosylamine--glycine ligase [Candidatus Ancillula trichonymphae]